MTSQQLATLSLEDLSNVSGGDADGAVSGLKRAQDTKGKGGSLDLFGYAETEKQGVGVEARQRLSPNLSVFGRATTGTKNDKPDNGVMGGIRFEW